MWEGGGCHPHRRGHNRTWGGSYHPPQEGPHSRGPPANREYETLTAPPNRRSVLPVAGDACPCDTLRGGGLRQSGKPRGLVGPDAVELIAGAGGAGAAEQDKGWGGEGDAQRQHHPRTVLAANPSAHAARQGDPPGIVMNGTGRSNQDPGSV